MTPNFNSHDEEESIDLKRYFFLFLNKWYWFVFAGFIGLVCAFLINRYSTPVYESSNTVIITDQETSMGAMGSIMEDFSGLGGKSQNIENQIGILSSYTLTKRTLERLNYRITYFNKGRVHDVEVYKNCPIVIDLDTSFSNKTEEKINITILSDKKCKIEIDRDSLKVSKELLFGEQFISEYYNFAINKTIAFDSVELRGEEDIINETYIATINDYSKLTKAYLKKLNIEATSKKGTLLKLTSQGNVKEKVVEYLNTLILVAIENDLYEKNVTSYKTLEFIDNQLHSIVDSLNSAEQNLETFRSDNKIVDLSAEGTALFEKLEEQQAKKSLLNIKIKYYEYLSNSIKENSNFQDVITPSVIGVQDPLLNSLVGQLSQLYSEKQVIEFSATGDNPSIQIINLKLKSVLTSLRDNVKNLIASSKMEGEEIQKEINQLDVEIKKLPRTERELINIQRRFELNDNIYNYLLQKRAEVGITKAANLPDLKFIDMAYVDNTEQKSPNKMLNYIIALFLSLIIPAIYLIARDFFNDKIMTREEIELKTNIPILGSVAHNRRQNEILPVQKHPKSSIAESIRTIRTNLAFFLKNIKSHTPIITFTSTISGEGKTFCALNLAAMIAMNNKKVLVVGLDLRKPKLQEMLKTNFSLGISNYLIGKNPIEEIIMKTELDNLDVILSGPIPPNPIELIESKEFEEFIDTINTLYYDYIIFDTPPIGLVADTLSISKYSDLNVFVMRQNYTNKNSIKFINDINGEEKIHNLSILINDVDMLNSYGYRYGGYGNKYGYGYYDEDSYADKNIFDKIKGAFSKS